MKQQLVDTVGAFLAQDYPTSSPALYVKLDKTVTAVCGVVLHNAGDQNCWLHGVGDELLNSTHQSIQRCEVLSTM